MEAKQEIAQELSDMPVDQVFLLKYKIYHQKASKELCALLKSIFLFKREKLLQSMKGKSVYESTHYTIKRSKKNKLHVISKYTGKQGESANLFLEKIYDLFTNKTNLRKLFSQKKKRSIEKILNHCDLYIVKQRNDSQELATKKQRNIQDLIAEFIKDIKFDPISLGYKSKDLTSTHRIRNKGGSTIDSVVEDFIFAHQEGDESHILYAVASSDIEIIREIKQEIQDFIGIYGSSQRYEKERKKEIDIREHLIGNVDEHYFNNQGVRVDALTVDSIRDVCDEILSETKVNDNGVDNLPYEDKDKGEIGFLDKPLF